MCYVELPPYCIILGNNDCVSTSLNGNHAAYYQTLVCFYLPIPNREKH